MTWSGKLELFDLQMIGRDTSKCIRALMPRKLEGGLHL